jgi:secreted trypsin-like serine protease
VKETIKIVVFSIFALTLQGLILRHDVPDEKFVELAKQYPQICHLPMGEGALIDTSWIITAGHIGNDLVRDMNNGYSPTVTCNGTKYPIEKVVVHPNFAPLEQELQNDIALIKIKGSIKNITPAKIYSKRDEKGKTITIVGMGDVGTGKTGPQKWDKITRAATNIIDGTNNQWIYFTFDSPTSRNVTKLEGISGPGDSGGPAFMDIEGTRYLVGISSHQKGQAKYGKGKYGVTEYYARVSSYKAWITETLTTQ